MKIPFFKRKARERLEADRRQIDTGDLETVVGKADKIEHRFRTHGTLRRFIEDGRLMIMMVKDYLFGNYRQVPWWAITAIAAALLYVLNPLDLIPDFIPIIGYLDDGMVVAACLLMVEHQLQAYKQWKGLL